MRDGERCPDCLGRGLVRKPSELIAALEAEAEAATAEERGDGLDDLPIAQLRKLAVAQGISGTGKKVELIAALRTVEQTAS